MFDSLFNLIIVLIPLSIFIGRIVVRARSKRQPPPPPSRIPVHFEDDDDIDDIITKPTFRSAPKPVPKQTTSVITPFQESLLAISKDDSFNKASRPRTPGQTQAAKGTMPVSEQNFSLYLNHLSPLKQAVVMAEILGPPKGMI